METFFIMLCLLGGTVALSQDSWLSESSDDKYADYIFNNLVPGALSAVEGERAAGGAFTLDGSTPGGVAKRARFMMHSFGPGLRYLLLHPRPNAVRGRAALRLHFARGRPGAGNRSPKSGK
ncbi:uncharacterized protein LOC144881823 [Branchiostoma floridae x Branchiostoma japonicum]